MRGSGALIVLLIFGAIAVYVLVSSSRLKGATKTSTSTAPTNDPYATQLISLQEQIINASGAIGKTAGGSAGAAAGTAVSSAEQEASKGLGQTPLSDAQIYALSHNSAQNGLVIGATAGANASSAAGGATGASPFDFIAAFFRGAGSSELLRPGGVADQLGLPKWGG